MASLSPLVSVSVQLFFAEETKVRTSGKRKDARLPRKDGSVMSARIVARAVRYNPAPHAIQLAPRRRRRLSGLDARRLRLLRDRFSVRQARGGVQRVEVADHLH